MHVFYCIRNYNKSKTEYDVSPYLLLSSLRGPTCHGSVVCLSECCHHDQLGEWVWNTVYCLTLSRAPSDFITSVADRYHQCRQIQTPPPPQKDVYYFDYIVWSLWSPIVPSLAPRPPRNTAHIFCPVRPACLPFISNPLCSGPTRPAWPLSIITIRSHILSATQPPNL